MGLIDMSTLVNVEEEPSKDARFVLSVSRRRKNSIRFNEATHKLLKKFAPCVTVKTTKDKSVIVAIASEIGLNPKRDLCLANKTLYEHILSIYPAEEIVRVLGQFDADNKCVVFGIIKDHIREF